MNDIVVGATRRSLDITITDGSDTPINLTGYTAAPKLQGASPTCATTIDATGTVIDAANGRIIFYSLGSLVTHANLNGSPSATFACRVKWTDAAGKVDYSDQFELRFLDNPLGA